MSEDRIGKIGSYCDVIATTVTRPSDTTAYASGDVITNSTSAPVIITLANCAATANNSGVIMKAKVIDSANQTTAATLEAWIFNATITMDNDNAVFTPTDAELLTLVCVIPFPNAYVGDATSGAGGNRVYISDQLAIPYKCVPGSKDLYAVLVVRNAYTPVSAETFTLQLRVLQD